MNLNLMTLGFSPLFGTHNVEELLFILLNSSLGISIPLSEKSAFNSSVSNQKGRRNHYNFPIFFNA